VCLDNLMTDAAEQVAQDLPVVFLVLDHKNLAHAFSTCRSTLTGNSNEKVEPRPGSDSTHSLPPCISMMRREIARPSPVPPFSLVVEESACWNSSKILAWSAVAMPGPVSRTATVKRPFVALTLIATSPWSVNLIALPVR